MPQQANCIVGQAYGREKNMSDEEKMRTENAVLRNALKSQMQRQRRLEIENCVLRESIRRISDKTKSENTSGGDTKLTIEEIRFLTDSYTIDALVNEWILEEARRSAEEEEKNER